MLHSFGHLPSGWLLFATMAACGFLAFAAGHARAVNLAAAGGVRINTQPNDHGYFMALAVALPVAGILVLQVLLGETIARHLLTGELPTGFAALSEAERAQYMDRITAAAVQNQKMEVDDSIFGAVLARYITLKGAVTLVSLLLAFASAGAGWIWARRQIRTDFQARQTVESALQWMLFASAALAIATTAGIVVSLLIESLRFFGTIPVFSFLFGLEWNAQTNTDFGAIPLFFGTFLIALIAMAVAAPTGIYAAIYLAEYASPRTRAIAKPMLEVLAGIPTVVYGFFALLVVAPAVRTLAIWLNGLPFIPDEFFAASPSNALAAGLVMGVMIIPFVSSLADDVIVAVPQSLRDAAYAMGATRSETIKEVVLPAALPGVIASLLLGVSRAIGETMIVVMAAGQRPAITLDPTSEITTITVQVVALLTGDSAFDSPKTRSAFALGFVLFLVTLTFNLIALRVVQKYREKYD